jgi:hypothetical protein
MLFSGWFPWRRRPLNNAPSRQPKNGRRTVLRLEQLENRVVLDGGGLPTLILGPVAAHLATGLGPQVEPRATVPGHVEKQNVPATDLAEVFDAGDSLDFPTSNQPIGPGLAELQIFGHPAFERLAAPASIMPAEPGRFSVTLSVEISQGETNGDAAPMLAASAPPPADIVVVPDGGPVNGLADSSAFSRPANPVPGAAPTVSNQPQMLASQPGIVASITPIANIGNEPGRAALLDRTLPPNQIISFTSTQLDPPAQTLFADASKNVPIRSDAATPSSQPASVTVAKIGVRAHVDRLDGRTNLGSTTSPDMDAFSPEEAGLITGGLPFGLAALEHALRDVLDAEARIVSAGQHGLRFFGVSAWALSAALAYVLARQPSRPTTDFDELSALRKISLKRDDRR